MFPQALLLALLGMTSAQAGSSMDDRFSWDAPRERASSALPAGSPRSGPAASGRRTSKPSKPSTSKPAPKPTPTAKPPTSGTKTTSPAVPVRRPTPSTSAPSTSAPPTRSPSTSVPANNAPSKTSPPGAAGAPTRTLPQGTPGVTSAPGRSAPSATRTPGAPSVSATGAGRPGVDGYVPTRANLADRTPPSLGQGPNGGTRPFTGDRDPGVVAPHRSNDHRYARPSHVHVRTSVVAHYAAPVHLYYRPWYTRWYVHPYYRWCYATTVVVGFGFATYAWYDYWTPPMRYGWAWSPGYWAFGWWHPGYWVPVAPPPPSYVYVPGWWEYEDVYVEGYYRVADRDGWEWVEGYYLEDGTYVRGHWTPTDQAPEGYLWEPGFYDGEIWVDGFWRPEHRRDYTWVSAWYDEEGVFHSGYWQPTEAQPGYVWVPGWFDGNEWIEGYWVTEQEWEGADVDGWTAPEGWDQGWEVGDGYGYGEVVDDGSPDTGGKSPDGRVNRAPEGLEEEAERPLALPIKPPVEAKQ